MNLHIEIIVSNFQVPISLQRQTKIQNRKYENTLQTPTIIYDYPAL